MDHGDLEKIKARMLSATKWLHDHHTEVGEAKQIREFASERRRNLLSKYIDPEEPVTKGEHLARKNPDFLREIDEQAEQFKAATTIIEKHAATCASLDAARSFLALERESIRQLEG